MNDGQKVSDLYTKESFQALLSDATDHAKNAWEEEFVEKLQGNFEKYGTGSFLSDKQNEILNRIAEGGHND